MSDRIKVLMLTNALYTCGAERFLVGLATNLPKERYDVAVCSTRVHRIEARLIDEVVDAGLRHVNLGRSGRYDVRPFGRLAKLLREERFDILHAHKFGSNFWGTLFGRLMRVPVVIAHEQTWSYEGQPVRRFLDGRFIGRAADVMIAVSTRDQERMTSVEGVPAEKTRYIPNAFVGGADVQGGDLRAELGLGPDVPLVGSAAVLRAQKAMDVLIDAFALLSERMPDAHLAIGGDGPMLEPWQEHARSRGLDDGRMHWLGMRKDLPVVLRGLDVAAMSSDFEGTPLFAFECMAAGTPLVATDVGGLRDIFEHGRDGLLVPPRDPAALAAGLETLLRDPDGRAAMARAATERLEDFTMERAVERTEALYTELLAAKGRPLPVLAATAA
jgi:glycosyltransferase involved in cell wall biosynthesis